VEEQFSPDLALEVIMLRWPLGFFIVALIAAALGFGGVAASAAGLARFWFHSWGNFSAELDLEDGR